MFCTVGFTPVSAPDSPLGGRLDTAVAGVVPTRDMAFEPTSIKALTFDVFGTVVDWRSSIIREGEAVGRKHGLTVDWPAFADAWRGLYQPNLTKVRNGEMPWTRLDDLHRMALDRLIVDFKITDLSEEETDHLNRAWHR